MRHYLVPLAFCIFFGNTANAQLKMSTRTSRAAQQAKNTYRKEASIINESFASQLRKLTDEAMTTSNADSSRLSPYLYQLVAPSFYYSPMVKESLTLDTDKQHTVSTPYMDYDDALRGEMSSQFVTSYYTNPTLFDHYDAQFANETVVESAEVQAKPSNTVITPIITNIKEIDNVADIAPEVGFDLEVTKPNFWKTQGKFSLQFTQNYFSENWYKGGNNNLTLLSNLVLEANYNDQKKIQWDNKLDLRLGFVTSPSDSCHTFLTSNDRINLYSKLGVKATKAWFYTISLEANSQFMPGYKANDPKQYSRFLAPLDVYVSIGMDFKPTFKNGNTLSCALLPLSYKMRYINSDNENIHKVYNMVDKTTTNDFGSKVEINSKVTIVKNLTWKCRAYYFTTYTYTEAELENSFQFAFNKYISTEVYTLWRFDDNRSRDFYDRNLGYFQFKEYLTLGLSYNF